jgi:hypothetical protein
LLFFYKLKGVIKAMDVNEHEKLLNITLILIRHTLK